MAKDTRKVRPGTDGDEGIEQLVDVQPHEVSLVRRGANRWPLLVVKAEASYGEDYYRGQQGATAQYAIELGRVSGLIRGSTVLDVGCGVGRAIDVLSKAAPGHEPYTVTGIDPSSYAVGVCVGRGMAVKRGAAEDLDLDDGAVDTVVSLHALEHVTDLEAALAESVRVAKHRAVHLVPLGKRADPTHQRTFERLANLRDQVDACKAVDGVARWYARIPETNAAVLVLDKDLPGGLAGHLPSDVVTVIPDCVCLVGSQVKGGERPPEDLDLVVRAPLDQSLALKLRNLFPKGVRERVHLIDNPPGPHDDYVALYDMALVPVRDPRRVDVAAAALAPLQRFTPLKTGSGYTAQEYAALDVLWTEWAEPLMRDGQKIAVDEKANGWRTVAEVDENGRTLAWFEDSRDDVSGEFPPLVEDLRLIAGGAVLDLDLGATYEDGSVVPRRELAGWRRGVAKMPVADVQPGALRGADDDELGSLNLRMHELYARYRDLQDGIVRAASFVRAEMRRRGMTVTAEGPLAAAADAVAKAVADDGSFATGSGAKARIRPRVFDLLWWNGEDLHEKPWAERRAKLEALFAKYDFRTLQLLGTKVTATRAAFEAEVKRVSAIPGSEGAVCKVATSTYPLTGQTTEWAKIKKVLEIKAVVLGRTPVRGSAAVWNYRIGIAGQGGEVFEVGETFNSAVDAKDGTALTVTAEEVIPSRNADGSWHVGFVVPRVQDVAAVDRPEGVLSVIRRAHAFGVLQATPADLAALRAADVIKEALKLEGNLDFSEGDAGNGILQTHERGLTEAQAKGFPSVAYGWEPLALSAAQVDALQAAEPGAWAHAVATAAAGDSGALAALVAAALKRPGLTDAQRRLLALADPVSVHTDIRLRRRTPRLDNYWEGGEGFTPGNQYQRNKFAAAADDPAVHILANFKVGRADEGGAGGDVIRGPLVWLTIGGARPEAFPPGAVGSTANGWSRFRVRDRFTWKAGVQDKHFKEFWFDGGVMKGRWIFTFAPVGQANAETGGRAWMISRPADQAMRSRLFAGDNKQGDGHGEAN